MIDSGTYYINKQLSLSHLWKKIPNNYLLVKVLIKYWNPSKKQGYFDLVDEFKPDGKKDKKFLIKFDRKTFGDYIYWFRYFKSYGIKFNIIVQIKSNQEAIIVKYDREFFECLIEKFTSKSLKRPLKQHKDKVQNFTAKIDVDANTVNQKPNKDHVTKELSVFQASGAKNSIECELMYNVMNSKNIVNKKLKSLQISGVNILNTLKGLKFISLKSLNLSNQYIDKESCELINSKILKQSIRLCRLDLTCLKIQNSETDYNEIFKGVNQGSVKILKFNQNNLDISKLNILNKSVIFPSQYNLKQIEFSNCFLFGKKLNHILSDNLTNLTLLNLSNNVNMLLRDWYKVTRVVFDLPYFKKIIAHQCELDDLITKIKENYIKEVKIKKNIHSIETSYKKYYLNE
eukprot:Mrub_03960.p1 GENE.Mrub_03960~~Mrub_03960.p1  ORF type:complete len:401 (-),score=43.21 Mrub_03960:70-1272(-)